MAYQYECEICKQSVSEGVHDAIELLAFNRRFSSADLGHEVLRQLSRIEQGETDSDERNLGELALQCWLPGVWGYADLLAAMRHLRDECHSVEPEPDLYLGGIPVNIVFTKDQV